MKAGSRPIILHSIFFYKFHDKKKSNRPDAKKISGRTYGLL